MPTINDIYEEFTRLHGSETPVRTRDELRAEIHSHGVSYDFLEEVGFWNHVFENDTEGVPWAYGGDCPGEFVQRDDSED